MPESGATARYLRIGIQKRVTTMMRILAFTIGMLVASTASAMKGDEFARLMEIWNRENGSDSTTPENALSAGMFVGYLRGVEDSMQGYRFCIPAETQFSRRVILLTKYVREHPDELHNGATTVIVEALQPAFPCPTQQQ